MTAAAGKVVALLVGGACGTLLRYAVSGWAYEAIGKRFAWGTLAVNMIGCFVIGLLWALLHERYPTAVNETIRLGVLTGVLGAFTTFSTFALETMQRLQDGQILSASANVAVSVALGLVLVYLGLAIGRVL